RPPAPSGPRGRPLRARRPPGSEPGSAAGAARAPAPGSTREARGPPGPSPARPRPGALRPPRPAARPPGQPVPGPGPPPRATPLGRRGARSGMPSTLAPLAVLEEIGRGQLRRGPPVLVCEETERLVPGTDPRREKPDPFEIRDDAPEHRLPERSHQLALHREALPLGATEGVRPVLLVELPRQEAVAKQERHLEGPVLAFHPLSLGEASQTLLERQHTEVHVARLVGDDPGQQLLQQRLAGDLPEGAER